MAAKGAMMDLSNAERETHLNLVAADRSTWHVYSDDPVMIRRLEAIGATLVKVEHGGGKHYTLPDSQVTLRRAQKPMSEARKAQLAKRLAEARANA